MSLNPSKHHRHLPIRTTLNVETLEERVMLSSVEIFAAGATGHENVDLFIDGQYVTTFFGVGGDVESRDFQKFTYNTDQVLTPGRIGVAFGNDAFDSETGLDRNLLVDRIAVDGVVAQTEDPATHSTGIYRDGLTGPGFFETELFNINAIFTYSDSQTTPSGDVIEFTAFGTTGEEVIDLVIQDQVVASFSPSVPNVAEVFTFVSDKQDLAIEDVRIEFNNDQFDPTTGADRNVQVNTFQVTDAHTGAVQSSNTFDANVLSSGIFVDGVGITSGRGAGGFLAGNGFVQVADSAAVSSVRVDSSFAFNEGVNSLSGPNQQAVSSNGEVAIFFQNTFGGEILIVDANGQPVTSFAENGRLSISDLIIDRIPGDSPSLNFTDIEFFDDGSLLVAGLVSNRLPDSFRSTTDNVFVVKINRDGSLDSTFAQQGVLTGTFLQPRGAVLITIDNSSRIIIAGENRTADGNNPVLARLNADGTLDTSFGNSGNVFLPVGEFPSGILGTAIIDAQSTSDGGVILGTTGDSGTGRLENGVGFTRLDSNGFVDRNFGNNGVFRIVEGIDRFLLDSQDRIIFDFFGDGNSTTSNLGRLTASGIPDSSFGGDGFVVVEADAASVAAQGGQLSVSSFISGLALDSNDNILVTDSTNIGGTIIQRVNTNGQLDLQFGPGGVILTEIRGDIIGSSESGLYVIGRPQGTGQSGLFRIEFV